MAPSRYRRICLGVFLVLGVMRGLCDARDDAPLPAGVKAVWDLDQAHRQTTPSREQICINGLWRWQPARTAVDQVPGEGWGYFKVPGCWPGLTDYMQKESQAVHAHPDWKNLKLRELTAAWYQRAIAIPRQWAGRRITLCAECLNSFATVYVDGNVVGQLRFPGGEVDLTSACRPGRQHVLTLCVLAMPLKAVMLSYSDTNSAKEVKGAVRRRGLCGDVYLAATPAGARLADVRIDTSLRKAEIVLDATVEGIAAGQQYALAARITDNGREVAQFKGPTLQAEDIKEGRVTLRQKWKPEKLWDIHTPQHQYDLHVSLLAGDGKPLDACYPLRFGFREFWINGRDFYLNGTRIFLSGVPLDNAQISAHMATYASARETLARLKGFGINFVYTHNYGCQPGDHLGFAEILRAADDAGVLVSFSQPHLAHYEWTAPDADRSNGYARHAEFYVRAAQHHPSVVMYSMNHNATGYGGDMDPDLIDGIQDPRDARAREKCQLALRAEAIVKRLDPGRVVYHHSSGNLGSMHTINFYPNFVPIQEMSDWFEHWATRGVKPLFTCEYAAPFPWDWAMYRGWYKGERTFGSARVPWEFCLAEWNAQFLGDQAYRISDAEKANLRWEAKKFRAGQLWQRWDYPHALDSSVFTERDPVFARYIADNWRAFRTWEMSANSPWSHSILWRLRQGVDKGRKDLKVDWDNLQRPGFSADFVDQQYEKIETAFERADWIAGAGAQALIRNNGPLLAYIGGAPAHFTSKEHNFLAGQTVEKQIIVINNSREPATCDCRWTLRLPQAVAGVEHVSLETGRQQRIPVRLPLPATLTPGQYELNLTAKFGTGESQQDSLVIHVVPAVPAVKPSGRIALFDPAGETGKLLAQLGAACQPVDAAADLGAYDLLIIGKAALSASNPAPNIGRVREGLKVIVFEQTAEALEKRLGFRVAEYGLRQVFPRVPDHPLLAGIAPENLRDWRGEATILLPRLTHEMRPRYGPTVPWCGIPVTRLWRCGNRGNVASVLLEKPACGDFLPILDGGFSLQYSPLLEYREGKGLVLFCQMDVTGRSESDPAAATLAANLLRYVSACNPAPVRRAVYVGDPAGKRHIEAAGVSLGVYEGGALSDDQVLVVGPGGGKQLAGSAAAIAAWLSAGGSLLAIGLDEGEASAVLPWKVGVKKREHIAAYFEPPGRSSLLAGVGPADVHNRAPRELPLVTAGATSFGDGVLAHIENARVVFCQMVPWQFDPNGQGEKRTFRRASCLVSRLLANMGVAGATPLATRFGSPVGDGQSDAGRWLHGLYLDKPEEWDDPYRSFRW